MDGLKEFLNIDSGSGYGSGSGSGSGYGYGDGYGDGSGSGYGSGYGSGVKSINGKDVHTIDDTQTIITWVRGNLAKGAILQSDLSLTPCFVIKGENHFAHGKTLNEAREALTSKLYEDMPVEDRIQAFANEHKEDIAYPNQNLFEWHHRLTGSCLTGREAFVKDRGIDLDGTTTVAEFIDLTKDAYGGDVIRQLENVFRKEYRK